MSSNQDVTKETKQTTAAKILATATDLFIKNGFDATSISQIASQAGVNRSLIFHHYTNKSSLWVECKKDFFRHNNMSIDAIFQHAIQSRGAFIEEFLIKRFHFYQANPSFVRLMAWQSLDQQDDQLTEMTKAYLDKAANVIQQLQQKNEISSTLNPTTILLLITTMVSGYFIRNISTWVAKEEEQQYLETIITLISEMLTPRN